MLIVQNHFPLTTTIQVLLLSAVFFGACNQPQKPNNTPAAAAPAASESPNVEQFKNNQVPDMATVVLCILQDRNGNYWFGTEEGAYRYDGKSLIAFREKDGLSQNQVQKIGEDAAGNIWFATGAYGINRFDGEKITTPTYDKTPAIRAQPNKGWTVEPGDVWFGAGCGAFRVIDSAVHFLPFLKPGSDQQFMPGPANQGSAYAVYSTLKDKSGNIWLGTQAMGVCRFDGRQFTWFNEKGLRGPAVLALFEDRSGNLWFGNNGSGLFRYDGKVLTNVTEEKGLSNPAFVSSGKQGPGTLARVWAINEDVGGNIWVGTGDAGVWCYDGVQLSNFTAKDGLPDAPIETIYQDKKGALWFGTNGAGVYQWNGVSFVKCQFANALK